MDTEEREGGQVTRDLAIRAPSGYFPVTRATDTEANAALGSWLFERFRAGCVDPSPCVMQTVVLPPLEVDGEVLPSIVVWVDADLVVERPSPPERRLRIVRSE